jgi:hypothetical protein
LSHLNHLMETISIIKLILEEQTDSNPNRHKEIHLSSTIAAIFSKMITGKPEWEQLIIYIKFGADFIDQMMDGLEL